MYWKGRVRKIKFIFGCIMLNIKNAKFFNYLKPASQSDIKTNLYDIQK